MGTGFWVSAAVRMPVLLSQDQEETVLLTAPSVVLGKRCGDAGFSMDLLVVFFERRKV
jgi:hypothetical protein